MPKGYKQKLKTHVEMAIGPARQLRVPHWTVEVRQRCAETRMLSRTHCL